MHLLYHFLNLWITLLFWVYYMHEFFILQEVLYSQRAKLYIYAETMLNKGTGQKDWIERGIGLMRVLKHREFLKLRLLMRQEKTMKVICNHILDPQIELVRHVQNDRSWIWVAYDFSDGSGELVETTFCLKFGDSDLAQAFQQKFLAYQEEMKTILSASTADTSKSADGGAAEAQAEEVAVALEGLSTKEN